MKAVVLVGGEGTRLRPLTETIPKPLVPLVDRPSLDHVLDHLARHGVHEVVLSSSYLEPTFHAFLEARHGDPAITWITEVEPLDTGGAIVNALPYLDDDAFFALNGDILTDLDLTAMRAFHEARGAVATIALHHVEDARPFGLVPTDAEGRVREFREKPAEPIPGDINAGTYLLDPGALAPWRSDGRVSIERQIFPALIEGGSPVFGFLSEAYWLDLGTPAKYLQAHADLLDGLVGGEPSWPAPCVDPSAVVDPTADLGRHVLISAGAVVAEHADVDESVLLEGVRIEAGAVVRRSILGPRSVVGAKARVDDAVLAEGAAIAPGAELAGARVSANAVAG
ncbi:MAG: sugar phosphate nucleotidyltransferase [Actinomycetota bacterium]